MSPSRHLHQEWTECSHRAPDCCIACCELLSDDAALDRLIAAVREQGALDDWRREQAIRPAPRSARRGRYAAASSRSGSRYLTAYAR